MADDKLIQNKTQNGGDDNNISTTLQLPADVSKLLAEKHEKISNIVDLDLETEETSPYRILKRASRDYIYGILGITIDPSVFSKITETLIKQRQILDSSEELNRMKKIPKDGIADNYALDNKKSA